MRHLRTNVLALRSLSACLSVDLLVATGSLAKTAEPIKMSFGAWSRGVGGMGRGYPMRGGILEDG